MTKWIKLIKETLKRWWGWPGIGTAAYHLAPNDLKREREEAIRIAEKWKKRKESRKRW